MHLISDPFLNSARSLKQQRDAGTISAEQYQHLYQALALAAEGDARTCEANSCTRPAYVIQRGRALCAVCALRERSQRR